MVKVIEALSKGNTDVNTDVRTMVTESRNIRDSATDFKGALREALGAVKMLHWYLRILLMMSGQRQWITLIK